MKKKTLIGLLSKRIVVVIEVEVMEMVVVEVEVEKVLVLNNLFNKNLLYFL
jgi:mannitol-specific phosphotransferase system IIBC component